MWHGFYTFFLMSLFFLPNMALAETKRIVMLGDSLTAGYGLESGQSLTTELESIINAQGHRVKIDNAGVSGDTTSGGLERLEWAISGYPAPNLVIIALGANDMLRGLPPAEAYKNLDAIINALKNTNTNILLIGMKSPLNMGVLFTSKFDAIYPDLAKKHKIPLYPFMLEGVALKPELNLPDGLHPNLEGTRIIAKNMAPTIIKALNKQ